MGDLLQAGGTAGGTAIGGPIGGAIGGALGGVAGGLLGGSPKPQVTTTQQVGTPEQMAALQNYFGGVQDFAAGGPQQYFQGDAVAGLTPEQVEARKRATEFAMNGMGGIQDQLATAGGANQNLIGQIGGDPSQQPGFRGMTDYLTQQTGQNLTENILPNIRAGSIGSGMFGGSKGNIAQGTAAGLSQQGLQGNIAQMLNSAYNQQNQQGLQAIGMTPQLAAAQTAGGLMPSKILEEVGGADQAYQQALIDEQMRKFNFEQQAPLEHLTAQQGLIGNVGQYGGTTTQTTSGGGNSTLQNVLGGALVGSSIFGGSGGEADKIKNKNKNKGDESGVEWAQLHGP